MLNKKGFQIIEDWAHNALLEDKDIDEERGVVLEEYRLGQGAEQRMRQEYLPKILHGSKYADRLPIGTKENLETFDYESIRSFYNDWYRPDLMSVMAVGDVDVEVLEQKIKDHFAHIKNSPQLETFIANKIPVLFMTDAVDEFWLQNIQKFKEKEFKSITKGKVDLSKLKKDSDKKDKINKNISKINDLINVLKKELEEKISNVIISDRLTKSPILLVADETSMDINMEKLMKMHNKKTQDSKKILEINPDHPMIIKLSETLTKVDHKKLSNLLLDQANILDGNVLSNPTNYIESLTDLFIKP